MPHEDARMGTIIQELVRRSNDEAKRLRDIEQRIDAMENKINTVEETSLTRTKKIGDKFSEAEMLISGVNDEIIKLKNSLDKINKQMDKFALRREVKEIEKMLELLTPEKLEEKISV